MIKKKTNFVVIFHWFLANEELLFEALWEDFDIEAGFNDLKFKIKKTLKRWNIWKKNDAAIFGGLKWIKPDKAWWTSDEQEKNPPWLVRED